MPDVTVLGLDGAGFHLLDRWLDDGTLPNLQRLMDQGSWQKLRSSLPPVTSPAWRCYSTGVNPGKHGVFWWEQLDRESRAITVPDSTSYDANNVWDYLGDDGYTSAVVNMPTTYPPEEINGWMVSGGGFTTGYTYPSDLQTELERELDYENHISVPKRTLEGSPEKITETNELIRSRFAAAEYIREEYDPDFLHLSLFLTNSIQHFSWGGEATKRMWECVDQQLGEFLQEDDNVVLMSDHGSNEIETVFNINSWFEQEGYLVTHGSRRGVLASLGINRQRGMEVAEKLRIKRLASEVIPESVLHRIPDSEGGVTKDEKATLIDWDRSRAVASGQGPIYVLADSNRDRVTDEIKSKLERVKAPNGKPVVRNVHRASEVYEGPYLEDGPNLVIEQADGVHIPGKMGVSSVFLDPADWKWESENHHDGMFVAHGPDIESQGQLPTKPTLYDLAPTILHWFGVPVPRGLDGDVLTDLFRADSDVAGREVEYSDVRINREHTDDEGGGNEEMEQRLRDLGYLSE
jgi:predicted AlkP superfamily phosphohydrolase/phosphomutase